MLLTEKLILEFIDIELKKWNFIELSSLLNKVDDDHKKYCNMSTLIGKKEITYWAFVDYLLENNIAISRDKKYMFYENGLYVTNIAGRAYRINILGNNTMVHVSFSLLAVPRFRGGTYSDSILNVPGPVGNAVINAVGHFMAMPSHKKTILTFVGVRSKKDMQMDTNRRENIYIKALSKYFKVKRNSQNHQIEVINKSESFGEEKGYLDTMLDYLKEFEINEPYENIDYKIEEGDKTIFIRVYGLPIWKKNKPDPKKVEELKKSFDDWIAEQTWYQDNVKQIVVLPDKIEDQVLDFITIFK
jgi:hypothetical protein